VPVSPSFQTFVVDQLSRVVHHVRARRMFGGVGIYSGEVFFALIADDTLYFKVDDSNRADFEKRQTGPFRPYGAAGEIMQYYQVPDELLEDVDALRPWAEKALAVAARMRQQPAPRRPPPLRQPISKTERLKCTPSKLEWGAVSSNCGQKTGRLRSL